jgi:deazaflavin-dependent oxidoreductase (nitroreductase family)
MAENDWNRSVIEEFRANAGKVASFEGRTLLLLHTTGARSGQPRVNPLVYQAVEGGYAVFASKAGAPSNPHWYHNLLAHPQATIEVGTDMIDVTARVAEPAERDEIWTRQKRLFPNFADYEQKTDRTIPVVILDPSA